ncbi:MAG: hypothetical protein K8S25_03575 [Alphaproteobacteria bacterium]|nr:hypothetical protein [Alphaproteobacteria bacterium]
MPEVATPRPRGRFDIALMAGIFWGVVGVFVVAAAFVIYIGAIQDRRPQDFLSILRAAAVFAIVMAVPAIFPAGFIGGAIGWFVYRAGIVSRWAYAVVGAVAALLGMVALQLLMAAIEGDVQILTDDFSIFIEGVFAIIGAFGGYMGGRVLERP